MEIILGVVADAANVGEATKLNILGIFQDIYAIDFPSIHPQMSLAVAFRADPIEKGKYLDVKVTLLDPDSKELFTIDARAQVEKEHPSFQPVIPLVLNLRNVVFPIEGTYRFVVSYKNDEDISREVQINLHRHMANPLQVGF